MTDYTRYHVDSDETSYHIAIWCQDCIDPESGPGDQDDLMIWQNTDEQVTALCIANLMAEADEHEAKHHASDGEPI